MKVVGVVGAPARKLTVRLAENTVDINAVQTLRYQVFYDEMGAMPTVEARRTQRDGDGYDGLCDHLMVEDHGSGDACVVGTYRLLRQSVAHAHSGFYSAAEFDLSPLIHHASVSRQELLELGRSCVARAYRDSGTIQLLWRGIADYLNRHSIGHLIGCASLPGADASAHADVLAYLLHHHLAPLELRAHALPDVRAEVGLPPLGGYDARLAMRRLPPLIKGYLRVGAMIGDGAFVDRQFNTVDVFMVMPVDRIAARYSERFSAAA